MNNSNYLLHSLSYSLQTCRLVDLCNTCAIYHTVNKFSHSLQQAYSIVPGEQDSLFFIIDESTGEITTDSSFDREKDKEVYVINVLARNVLDLADGGANQGITLKESIYQLCSRSVKYIYNSTALKVDLIYRLPPSM